MGQPVKLSDRLVQDARLTGELTERSIASQIELWAALGRAIEPLLRGAQALGLLRAGKALPLSACLEMVNTAAGRKRLTNYLASRPYPHFEPVPGRPGLLLRTEADGRKTVGRFVRREFLPVSSAQR